MSLLLLGPLCVRSGYGSLARGMARGFARLRPGFGVFDLVDFPGGRLRVSPELRRFCLEEPPNDRVWLRVDVPWRGHYPQPRAPSFLYTMFEAGPIDRAWAARLSEFTGILVPSSYCEALFREAGCPVRGVVRPGVGSHYHPGVPPLRVATRGMTLLFVGEYTHRKGLDILVRAYGRAFRASDDVTLVVKTWSSLMTPGQIEASLSKLLASVTSSIPHVLFLHPMVPDELMPSLYRAAHVLVMPSRSEGFGLPALEALACGVPVVAPAVTGLADVVSEDTCFVVETQGMRPAKSDGLPWDFYGGRLMPEPSEEHMAQLMRLVYEHPSLLADKAARASARRRTWDEACEEILAVVVPGAGEPSPGGGYPGAGSAEPDGGS